MLISESLGEYSSTFVMNAPIQVPVCIRPRAQVYRDGVYVMFQCFVFVLRLQPLVCAHHDLVFFFSLRYLE